VSSFLAVLTIVELDPLLSTACSVAFFWNPRCLDPDLDFPSGYPLRDFHLLSRDPDGALSATICLIKSRWAPRFSPPR